VTADLASGWVMSELFVVAGRSFPVVRSAPADWRSDASGLRLILSMIQVTCDVRRIRGREPGNKVAGLLA